MFYLPGGSLNPGRVFLTIHQLYFTTKTIIIMRTLIIIIAVLIATSCTTVRQAQFDKHPEWSEQTVRLINNNQIREGMTKDMVLASWARPDNTGAVVFQGMMVEYFEYCLLRDGCDYVYFKDNKVISYSY